MTQEYLLWLEMREEENYNEHSSLDNYMKLIFSLLNAKQLTKIVLHS
jgi:hypothetical protein